MPNIVLGWMLFLLLLVSPVLADPLPSSPAGSVRVVVLVVYGTGKVGEVGRGTSEWYDDVNSYLAARMADAEIVAIQVYEARIYITYRSRRE